MQRMGGQRGQHDLAELQAQRGSLGQLLVALDLRGLQADRFAPVGPRGGLEHRTHLADLFGAEGRGNMQQHE